VPGSFFEKTRYHTTWYGGHECEHEHEHEWACVCSSFKAFSGLEKFKFCTVLDVCVMLCDGCVGVVELEFMDKE
jgi:hypothetical protein